MSKTVESPALCFFVYVIGILVVRSLSRICAKVAPGGLRTSHFVPIFEFAADALNRSGFMRQSFRERTDGENEEVVAGR
jgi:hypothetical protein